VRQFGPYLPLHIGLLSLAFVREDWAEAAAYESVVWRI